MSPLKSFLAKPFFGRVQLCLQSYTLSQCAMHSDHPSMLRSRFRCRILQLLTLCSPLVVSDVLGYCLLVQWVTMDVQVSVSVEQEFALMCLWLHKRMRKLAEILWDSHPGADVMLTARHHPALSRTSLTSYSVWLVLLESR